MAQKLFDEQHASILQDIIASRRDVRGNNFLSDPIDDSILDRILLSAIHAPSVGFSQPWEFVIIKNPATREKIKQSFTEKNTAAAGMFPDEKAEQYKQIKLEGIIESPVNIAVFYKPSDGPVLGQTAMKEVGLYSVVCAIQNMWLMARSLNVGMGWVSILDAEKVKNILDAPEGHQFVAYLCLGYVDQFYDKPELEFLAWEKRKMMSEVIFYEGYKRERDENI
jgi:5,6-dimethylbenzimidazole synthase